jgi:hypothetical protein
MRIVLLSALLTTSVFAQQHRGGGGAPVGRMRSSPPVSRPFSRPFYPGGTVIVPFPVYYSNYAPYTEQAPAVYVNPDYRQDVVNPQIVDYSNVSLPEAAGNTDANELRDDQPTIILIALTDHTVVASIAYWVDGDTLNWVSRDAKVNRMSLSLVDRDFSKQLNDERHIEFKLPPAN